MILKHLQHYIEQDMEGCSCGYYEALQYIDAFGLTHNQNCGVYSSVPSTGCTSCVSTGALEIVAEVNHTRNTRFPMP